MDAMIEQDYTMKHVEEVEELVALDHPMDVFIQVALCSDECDVKKLYQIVAKAVLRLEWELENTPYRWTKVKASRQNQLSYWIFLQEKLHDFWKSIDPIPF